MNEEKARLPALITIFGAKGDLTRRKLVPALYNLYTANHLPQTFAIYCIDYLESDEKDFKAELLAGINEFSRNGIAQQKQWEGFSAKIFYIRGDFQKKETFVRLKEQAANFDKQNKQRGTRLFYFATAPRFIEIIAEELYKNKISNRPELDRIVIEKPFGTDLASAKKLNLFLSKRFAEKQVYRIDHYLGKEAVQNIMAFRFANYVFEPLWNNKFIDYIQISVAEEVGVGTRGGYYDSSGALRDMIQNHLLQLMCIVAMECPASYKAELIRDAKVNVLKQVRRYSGNDIFKNVVRAQYTAGTVNDKPMEGYRQDEQVSPTSTTETFVAAKFFIDNKRWKGVPFFLITGKSLPRQASAITVQFKDSPNRIFKDDIESNRLVISIQPELEIGFLFESKVPGLEMKLKSVAMDFSYQQAYTESIPEAYESLLLDVMDGDPTLFMRADQVENAWKVVMPILDAWKKYPLKQLHFYKAGSWGPKEAMRLIKSYTDELFQLPLSEKHSE
ncbi:MAG: glucose-6-phosphate dehydrogenase [Ginsengibacter sp.]